MNCVFESVFVEIVEPNNEKNVIMAVYTNPLMFRLKFSNDRIKQALAKIGLENKLCPF